ncbi:MAG: hypothetical protein JSW68_02760 [Burkholderiales bacterium]|nr:MAG: hypothetical protein JSW68_02760 [Burkholderiales bacterium]
MRASLWVYPLVNASHVLGIALLVGTIVVLDLRLLGMWPRAALQPVSAVLLPAARAGFALAAGSGLVLFSARPLDYAFNALFLAKLALIGLALFNAAALSRAPPWRAVLQGAAADGRVRLGAVVSLVLWLAILLLGRLIGYR